MKVSEIVGVFEKIVPPTMAEDWDNVGLLVGDMEARVRKIMLCIDLTDAVLAEAAKSNAQMVMAYHPVIFKPVGRVTAQATPPVYAAANSGIAVYSMHTALDAAPGGTNDVLAKILGLVDCSPIHPVVRQTQCKIVVFVPNEDLSAVAHAAFSAGAGKVGDYYDCGFFCHGIGTFCGGAGTHPALGRPGRHEAVEELRLEIVSPLRKAHQVCAAIKSAHSYERPAIEVYPLIDCPAGFGMGRIGFLQRPAAAATLVSRIKKATGLKKILIAKPHSASANGRGKGGRSSKPVSIAACCAGSGSDLYKDAAAAGATFYLTGEMRHHDALAASARGMTVACMGHSNSERIALGDLAGRLRKIINGVSVVQSKHDADPFEIV